MIPQGCQNPSFNNKNCVFYLSFVFGFCRSCRDNCGVIVLGQIQVCGIDIRFVSRWFGNAGLKVVRDKDFRYTAEELKGVNM